MQTWKKIVIASSVTLTAGVAAYYIWFSMHFKKIRERGFVITVNKKSSSQPVTEFPGD